MPDGGSIRIATQATKDLLTLLFSDSGMGMDERTQRKIFEPFFTTKADNLETGLGLSTVWGLVQGSGGRIKVESHPGEGTTCTISLPISKNQSDSDAKVSSAGQTSGLSILVDDDESSVSEVLKRMLGSHDVATAENGIEAQEMLNRRIYDLVITDWSLPGLSGLDLAHEVKSSSPQTLTALMTGWSTHGTAPVRVLTSIFFYPSRSWTRICGRSSASASDTPWHPRGRLRPSLQLPLPPLGILKPLLLENRPARQTSRLVLTRISHRWSTASPQSSALAVFRSVGLLDVLSKHDCGGSPRVVSGASLARTALAAPRHDKR